MEFPYYEDAYVGFVLSFILSIITYFVIRYYYEKEDVKNIYTVPISLLTGFLVAYAFGILTYKPDEILTGNFWD